VHNSVLVTGARKVPDPATPVPYQINPAYLSIRPVNLSDRHRLPKEPPWRRSTVRRRSVEFTNVGGAARGVGPRLQRDA
jgi:hypothetical protein